MNTILYNVSIQFSLKKTNVSIQFSLKKTNVSIQFSLKVTRKNYLDFYEKKKTIIFAFVVLI